MKKINYELIFKRICILIITLIILYLLISSYHYKKGYDLGYNEGKEFGYLDAKEYYVENIKSGDKFFIKEGIYYTNYLDTYSCKVHKNSPFYITTGSISNLKELEEKE